MSEVTTTATTLERADLTPTDDDAPEKVLSVGLPAGHWFLIDILVHDGNGVENSEKSISGSLAQALRLIQETKHGKCAKIFLCEGEPFGTPTATFLDEVLEVHRGATTYVLTLETGRTVCYSASSTDVAGRRLERLTSLYARQVWPPAEA
jgi:hypothetical protein